MRKFITVLALAVVITGCCPTKDSNKPTVGVVKKAEQYDLDAIVKTIQGQYLTAIDKLHDDGITDIEITDAEVSLTVTKSTTGNVEVAVLIATVSGSIAKNSSTTLTFTLSKEESTTGGTAAKLTDNSLADLIYAAGKKFHNLKNTVGDLKKKSLNWKLHFRSR